MAEESGPACIGVLSGLGGAGKAKILEGCEKRLSEAGIVTHRFVSATTRAPRPHAQEVHGVHYHFLSEEEFCALKQRDEFVEDVWKSDGVRYGLLKSEVRKAPANSVALVDTDLDGGLRISQIYPTKTLLVWVVAHVDPKSNLAECQRRMLMYRGDSRDSVERRFKIDREEAERIPHLLAHRRYHQVLNCEGGLAAAVAEVCALIMARTPLEVCET